MSIIKNITILASTIISFRLTGLTLRKYFSTMMQLLDKPYASVLMNDVDNFLLDCDGVLWDEHGIIEGSLETVQKLKALGKSVYYVTNNSCYTQAKFVEKCKKYGYPATADKIVCTANIAAQYLKTSGFMGKVYLVGMKESIGEELENIGIPHIGTGPDPLDGYTYEHWLETTKLDPEVKCVLIGFDPDISYMKIMKAASYLKKQDCLYITTNEDDRHPVLNSPIVLPGTGSMAVSVTLAAGRAPANMGKPAPHMFEVLRKIHDLDPKRCIMIGDRLDTDILFAKKCGLKSLLVLSGSMREEDLQDVDEAKLPDFYTPNLASLGQFI